MLVFTLEWHWVYSVFFAYMLSGIGLGIFEVTFLSVITPLGKAGHSGWSHRSPLDVRLLGHEVLGHRWSSGGLRHHQYPRPHAEFLWPAGGVAVLVRQNQKL